MAKKEINIDQFKALIREEAMKLNQRALLENEKIALQEELKGILGESYVGECGEEGMMESSFEESLMDEAAMEELFGNRDAKKAEKMKAEFLKYANIWKRKKAIRGMNQEMLDDLMQQAAADKYQGKPGLDKENQLMMYRPGDSINWGGLGLNRSGSFGGGA
jgi:adenylate cyclase